MCHCFVTEVKLLAISLVKCHYNCTCEQNTAKSSTESKIRLPTHESRDYLRRRKVIVFLTVRTHTAQLVLHSIIIRVFIYGNWIKIFDLSQQIFFCNIWAATHIQSTWLGGGTNYGAMQYSNLSTLLLLPVSLGLICNIHIIKFEPSWQTFWSSISDNDGRAVMTLIDCLKI